MRLRQNFLSGLIEGGLGSADTILTSAALANALPVAGGDTLAIVLDPGSTSGEPEIVYVIEHAAANGTARILRGQEGTMARAHGAGVKWAHGPTSLDMDADPIHVENLGMLRRILQAVNFARTSTDAMRIQSDGGAIEVRGVNWGWHSTYPTFYGSGAPNSIDARESLRMQHKQLLEERKKKWSFPMPGKWTPTFRKGVDLPIWDWLPFVPDRISYHGTANAYDGKRFMYWLVQHGTTGTTASTTALLRFDTLTEGWQFLGNATNGGPGMDLEYDAVRNVLYLIHGASATSWQVFNLNTTAVTIANVSCAARAFTTMAPVLPVAATYGASFTMPDDLSVVGALTQDGSKDIDTGTADTTGNTTTVVKATEATGTFGPGMVGLMVRVLTGAQAGSRRVISAVTNKNTLTLSVALAGALAPGDTFSIEVPEHTATAGTTTTLTNSTNATWAVNQYANADVIMVTGALAGQRRRIASNTADTLTLAAAVTGNARTGPFTAAPAAGDIFRIVPSSDFLYYQVGGATGFHRIDVAQTTGAAWAALATAPAATGGGGNTFFAGAYAPFQILCLRGTGTATLYAYSTGPNTWATLTTFPENETFTTGASATMLQGLRKIAIQKESSTRIYAIDLLTGMIEPLGIVPFANPGAYDGKRLKFVRTDDGAMWLYAMRAGGSEFFRQPLEQYA